MTSLRAPPEYFSMDLFALNSTADLEGRRLDEGLSATLEMVELRGMDIDS
jgi:hypothetical protein